MKAKLKNWQGTTQQILIGLVLATIVVAVIEANSDYDEECGWSLMGNVVSHYGRGDRHRIRIGRGRCRLDVDLRGDVDFTADNRGVARLGPEASLRIRERLAGERRRLDVERGADGKPEYTWFVGSLPKEYDDEARAWLAEVLPRIYRSTGLDADGRVRQLLAAGGLDAAMAEMKEISSDNVRGAYLRGLIAQTTDEGELVRIVDYARRELSSDHERARTLAVLDPSRLTSAEVRDVWVLALRSIDSDWQLRRALSSVVESGDVGVDVLEAVLEAARTVSSDHDQGELLKTLARAVPDDLELPPSFFQALESIGSDHVQKQTLSVALERPGLTEEEAGRLLATAREISGDYELAELLASFARAAPRAWKLPDSFFQVFRRIDGASAKRRVLEAVIDHRDLEPELAADLVEGARTLTSDSELAAFLVRFLEVYPSDAELPVDVDRLIKSVDSDYERSRVEDVLAAYRKRAPGSTSTEPAPEPESRQVEEERSLEAGAGSEGEP